MPRNTNAVAVAPNSALANLPDDVRADLLRAQAEQISTVQQLPRVKIMNGGAGLFEFSDTNDTVREFEGVILNSHSRNILWDKEFGTQSENEEENAPACVSADGRHGTPRPGFAHAALGGRAATGMERIDCTTCPYNQWDSKRLLFPGSTKKGKASTNQRAVYILMADREAPVELILPPTSLATYDEYLSTLVNRGIPVQTVVTTFKLERIEKNGFRWSAAKFELAEQLSGEAFNVVLEKRARYRNAIHPQDRAPQVEEGAYTSDADAANAEDLPF